MLTELCQECKNWFVKEIYTGDFTITGGVLDVDFLQKNQYYRIKGSIFNDGVQRFGEPLLTDETFTGEVWAMAVPAAFVALSERVKAWNDKYASADSAAMSPFASESFGGYSYTKGSRSGQASGSSFADWKDAFRAELNRWRKI